MKRKRRTPKKRIRRGKRSFIKTFLKLFVYFIIGIILYFPLNFSYEFFIADYSSDVDEKISDRGLSHFNTFHDRWVLNFEHDWKDLTGWEKTVLNMGHSYAAIGLLNMHFSSERSDKRIKEAIIKITKSLMKNNFNYTTKYSLNKLPRNGFGIYYGHALITLMSYRYITKKRDHDKIIRKIVKFLYRNSLKSKTNFVVPPYDQKTNSSVFPADQSAALLGMYLYDAKFKTKYHLRPFKLLRKRIKNSKAYKKYKLDNSGWRYKYSSIPRGVGLAYSLFNFAQIDYKRMKPLYDRFVKDFEQDLLGFSGFREWPKGITHPDDNDSGPIFFEIGTAATAMSIGVTKIYRDKETYNKLMKLESFVARPVTIMDKRAYLLLNSIFYTAKYISQGKSLNSINAYHFFTDACLFSNLTAYHWKLR